MQQVSAGASLIQQSLPHTANVVAHVVVGTLALLLGVAQLFGRKGDAGHSTRGRWFLRCVWAVVATAALGLAVFRFGAFLCVITLLVAYWAYSGHRTLRIRSTGPTAQDAIVSATALGAAGLFILYLQTVHFPWAPQVIYSTLGTLVYVATYDLVRFAFPKRWFETLWLYEHVVKMLGAFGALLSAFAGTVFRAWQPYSQLVPSLLVTVLTIGFLVRIRMRAACGREASARSRAHQASPA